MVSRYRVVVPVDSAAGSWAYDRGNAIANSSCRDVGESCRCGEKRQPAGAMVQVAPQALSSSNGSEQFRWRERNPALLGARRVDAPPPGFSRGVLKGGDVRLQLPERYRGARALELVQLPKQFRDLGPIPGIECTDEVFTIPGEAATCVYRMVVAELNATYRMSSHGVAAAYERERQWGAAFSALLVERCASIYPRFTEPLVQDCVRNAFRRERDNPFEVTETRDECFQRLGVEDPRPDQACREVQVEFFPWGMRTNVSALLTTGVRCNMRVCAG